MVALVSTTLIFIVHFQRNRAYAYVFELILIQRRAEILLELRPIGFGEVICIFVIALMIEFFIYVRITLYRNLNHQIQEKNIHPVELSIN